MLTRVKICINYTELHDPYIRYRHREPTSVSDDAEDVPGPDPGPHVVPQWRWSSSARPLHNGPVQRHCQVQDRLLQLLPPSGPRHVHGQLAMTLCAVGTWSVSRDTACCGYMVS